MNKIYYKKEKKGGINKKKLSIRIVGFSLFLIGVSIVFYIFTPLILWQVFLSPALASSQIASPIPSSKYVTPGSLKTIISSELSQLNTDYNDAKNWFPNVQSTDNIPTNSSFYYISIPKINITNAVVSSTDTDLAHHLVQFPGTAAPTEKGNTVIVGHSTLPSLYNPKDYKTIFANAHTLQTGDKILVNIGKITYNYKIFSITVVNPDDSSIFVQPTDDSYITIVTCTPPGTIWKRLAIMARIQNL